MARHRREQEASDAAEEGALAAVRATESDDSFVDTDEDLEAEEERG